jgi:membrane-associated protein
MDQFLQFLLDLILHPQVDYLQAVVVGQESWLYILLFAIIFCETGLVVTPFLPGDSLLFLVGVLASLCPTLNLPLLIGIMLSAAVLGDAVNYSIGYRVGPAVFRSEKSWLFNKNHLLRAQQFYEKYGSKTIVLARFIPIIRTFAPFVAGIGKMEYRKFFVYNVAGAVAWVFLFTLLGYAFGQIEWVQRSLHLITVVIVAISLVPIAVEFWLARRKRALAAMVRQPEVVAAGSTQGD